jgi:hypothetical protein
MVRELHENTTWASIENLVDAEDGVTTVRAGSLRIALGAGRLTPRINQEISAELDKRGLGHVPEELPLGQHELVRLYRRGSRIGTVIDAVQRIDPDADTELRRIRLQRRAASHRELVDA